MNAALLAAAAVFHAAGAVAFAIAALNLRRVAQLRRDALRPTTTTKLHVVPPKRDGRKGRA